MGDWSSTHACVSSGECGNDGAHECCYVFWHEWSQTPTSPRLQPLPQVGWPARPVKKVAAALANSYLVASIHLRVTRPGQPGVSSDTLIGMAAEHAEHNA